MDVHLANLSAEQFAPGKHCSGLKIKFWKRTGLVSKLVISVTVGTAIASRPPYRSVRAELPHTAPTLDGWRRNARQDKDAGREDEVSIVRRLGECASNSDGCADCDDQAWTATDRRADRGSGPTPAGSREQRDIGNSHRPHVSAMLPPTLTGSCIRWRSTALMLCSVARIRLRHGLASDDEMAFGVRRTVVREPKKREGLRFSFATPLPINLREATKLDQSRLLRMELQRKGRQPFPETLSGTAQHLYAAGKPTTRSSA